MLTTALLALSASTIAATGDALDTKRLWPAEADSITLYVCDAGSKQATEDLLLATATAAQTWNTVGAGPHIEVAGTGKCDKVVEYDGVNRVGVQKGAWPFEDVACGSTGVWRQDNDGAILEVDVALNPHKALAGPNAHDDGSYDLLSVVTHELGHSLGLPDIDTDPEATMFFSVNPGETMKRNLSDTDESLLIELYEGQAPLNPSCAQTNSPPFFAMWAVVLGALRRRSAARRG